MIDMNSSIASKTNGEFVYHTIIYDDICDMITDFINKKHKYGDALISMCDSICLNFSVSSKALTLVALNQVLISLSTQGQSETSYMIAADTSKVRTNIFPNM